MNAHRPLIAPAMLTLLLVPAIEASAQCTNPSQFPPNLVTPDASGLVTSITSCNWEAEHARITSIIAGAAYQFTIASGSFITVHQDTFDGPVLGYGNSPLTVVAATGGDLFVHWNVNSDCATAMNCYPTTVQLFLNCLPPQFTFSTTNDCPNSQFYLNVDVLDTGDASSLSLTYTVDGGPPNTQTGVGIGSYQFGPFDNLALVDLIVEHADDPMCNQTVNDITNFPCPILGCDPNTYTHCYGNNEEYLRTFQSTSSYPLRLEFMSGGVSNFGDDVVTIYDGLDDTAPPLYSGTGNVGDLTGLAVTSMNLDQALTIKLVSNAFTSCADGGILPWNYTVGCLDCTNPAATFEVLPDCLHHGFNVAVNVTDLGSSPDLRITDSWAMDTLSNIGLGTTIIGPIPVDQAANVTLLNSLNSLCRIVSADLFYPSDSCVVTACEPIAVEHCYTNADTAWFVYQSGTTTPVTISFSDGGLLTGDNVLLYNGINTSAQLVFAGNMGGQVGGLALSSSNPDDALTLLITSDGSGSCATGEASPALHWTVGCGLVGEEERTDQPMMLYPDPSSDELNVRWQAALEADLVMEIFDITGRPVMRERYHATGGSVHVFNVSTLPAGNYAVRFAAQEWSRTQHIQVVR